jgi:hypothetical protein
MLRKLVLALGVGAAIAAMTLSPTAASAKPWKHYHHGYRGGVAFYPGFYAGPACYTIKRVYVWNHVRHVRFEEVCE